MTRENSRKKIKKIRKVLSIPFLQPRRSMPGAGAAGPNQLYDCPNGDYEPPTNFQQETKLNSLLLPQTKKKCMFPLRELPLTLPKK